MDKPKRELCGCLGLAIVGVVVLIFLLLVRCQADFFQGISLVL